MSLRLPSSLLAAMCSLLAVTPCFGKTVIETRIDGQPLVYMKDGVVDGCGVRVIVVDVPSDKNALITAYDASFNIQAPGRGVVRAVTTDATLVDFESGKPERRTAIAPESFWFKAAGAKATEPNEKMAGKMARGADEGSVLYVSDLAPVVALFSSQRGRKPILMGVKRPGATSEKVFSGTIQMSDGENARIASCIRELAKRK